MDVGPLLIPHAQEAKLIQPRKRPLDHSNFREDRGQCRCGGGDKRIKQLRHRTPLGDSAIARVALMATTSG
jgi:hypothetical protein